MGIGPQLKAASVEFDRLRQMQTATRPGPEGDPKPVKVSVGIATYDDFDGAFFTVESLRLHHREVIDQAEIIILDNHPGGIESEALASLAKRPSSGANIRYLPFDGVRSTAVREVLFHAAVGEIVLILDTHVLLAPGAVQALVDFFDDPSHARDMAHGPLMSYDAVKMIATHMDPVFRAGMYGTWGVDDRGQDPDGEPFEITLSGLGLFAMRRDAWPGLNPRFHGFGGEEGYLHEKVRQAGGRVFCLPKLRWIHRFERPRGVPYRNKWDDRIHNYFVGWAEIGYPASDVDEHFAEVLREAYPGVREGVMALVEEPARQVDGFIVVSDGDRFGDWQHTLKALETVRGQYVRAEYDASTSWDQALLNGLEGAQMRGWKRVVIIDDRRRPTPEVLRDLATRASQVVDVEILDGQTFLVPVLGEFTPISSPHLAAPPLPLATQEPEMEPQAPSPARRDGIEQTDLSDGAVLFDPTDQVAHHLNASAMLVWELVDGRPVSSITQEVQRTLEIDPQEAKEYVRQALDQFADLGLLA